MGWAALPTAMARRGESNIGFRRQTPGLGPWFRAPRRRSRRRGASAAIATPRGAGGAPLEFALAEGAEWQTRRSQTPLIARSCGFESHLRHQALRGRLKARAPQLSGSMRRRSRSLAPAHQRVGLPAMSQIATVAPPAAPRIGPIALITPRVPAGTAGRWAAST